VRELRRILESAEIRRWPMYLRNVKQLLRQPATRLDERAYGFGNLVDLLRAAQKEGVLRVDRDRQGVIRVFQGTDGPPAVTQVAEAPPPPQLDLHHEPELPDENVGNVAPDPTVPTARRRRGGVTPGVARPARGRRSRPKP
jgi:hypothetical protein